MTVETMDTTVTVVLDEWASGALARQTVMVYRSTGLPAIETVFDTSGGLTVIVPRDGAPPRTVVHTPGTWIRVTRATGAGHAVTIRNTTDGTTEEAGS